MNENLKCDDVKYSYCLIKINGMFLKSFLLFNQTNDYNEALIEMENTFTTIESEALKIKIEDAHYLMQYFGEGFSLKYVY